MASIVAIETTKATSLAINGERRSFKVLDKAVKTPIARPYHGRINPLERV